MDIFMYIFLGVSIGIIIGAVVYLFILKKKKDPIPEDNAAMLLMQNQLENLSQTLDKKLDNFHKDLFESSKDMRGAAHTQFTESQRLIQDINKQLGAQMQAVTKQVTESAHASTQAVTRQVAESKEATKQVFTIADQLQNLEKVLKHQKQRGNLGEASLELSLSNILSPDQYKMQYQFTNGEAVDAVIKTKDGLIPIDAKFSLDNYNRIINEDDKDKKAVLEKEFKMDLTKRINETAKYIRPKEGTLPFAFMFIPAEGIYYDLLVNEIGSVKVNTRSLIDYAYKEKNVIIVSPTTFSAYLQSVLYGFRAFKIEESALVIRKNVEQLGRHLNAYDEYFKKLGKTLGTTVNHYNSAQQKLSLVDKDVMKITEGESEFEKIEVEKPHEE